VSANNLDPRLRRLVSSLSAAAAAALRDPELSQNWVTAALPAVGAPEPEDVFKRVLVMLNQDQIPEEFTSLHWGRVINRTYTVGVPLTLLAALGNHPAVKFVEAGREVAAALDTSLREIRGHPGDDLPAVPGFDGTGVVVGVIDWGCDYTLDDFRDANGSRIEFLWDQSLQPQPGEHAPVGFGYGVEYNRAAINRALRGPTPFEIVRHVPAPASHGTHVLGIAAGNGRSSDHQYPAGRFVGVAPNASLVFVQPARFKQAESLTDSTRIVDAISYIFEKARALRRPCVINLSLSQNGGSHDGESLIERIIDQFLEEPGRAFVVAAGNEHVWRGHASGVVGGPRVLHWKVGGGLGPDGTQQPEGPDRTANEMEIWYASEDRFRVRLADPTGKEVGAVDPEEPPLDKQLVDGNQVFIDSERFTALSGDARIFIELHPGTAGEVRRGVWTVTLEPLGEVRNGRFHAWIERDRRNPANNYADQSFFAEADATAEATVGTPGTARRSVCVASYDHRAEPLTPHPASGRGPTRDGRRKPDVAAPGVRIVSTAAQGGRPDGLGTRPVRTVMTGTSMAAPHVTGVVALLLQKNPRLTAAQILRILSASAQPVKGDEPEAWGAGRIDARRALDLVP
jgi:subtilisin family serine protease